MRFHAATGGGGDNFGDMLLKMIMARAAQGESQIAEHIERNAHTGAAMPLAQAAVAAVAVFAVLAGLGMIGSQAAFLFGWELLPGDYLLAGTLGLLVLIGAVAVVRVLSDQYSAAVVGVIAVGLAGLLLVALIAALLSHRDGLTWWRAGLIALGLAFVVPGLALAYRQLVDLVDPFGKISPMERALVPYLGALFGQDEPEQKYSRFVPYRRGNGAEVLNIGDGPLHPEDAALLEFARRAASVGLSRRVWLGQTLETLQTPVTRECYEELMGRLVHLAYVVPGGQGIAARWAVPASEAVADLEMQAEMGETNADLR